MPRQAPQPESSGPMKGHIRRGRRYFSPLAYTGVLGMGDWVRDDLPDLLWPALTLHCIGSSGALNFIRWQQQVQQDLSQEIDPATLADYLSGRLTGLDRLRELSDKAEESIRARASEWNLLLPEVCKAITSYPEHPAQWLFDSEFSPPGREELELLAGAVVETLRDGHREAIIKCLPIWSAVQAGTFRSSSDMIEILKPYPNDPETRGMADSMIRASWGASRAAKLARDASAFDDTIKWAKVFWGINSMTSRCIRERDLVDPQVAGEDVSESDDMGFPQASDSKDEVDYQQLAMDLMSSYCEALETAPARLYDQEMQEVHAGLVSRASRDVIAALGSPNHWCLEHGASINRMLVETRIYLQWMATQSTSIYREFQEYGAGKAKLYARILSEVDTREDSPDVDEAVAEFERLSHNHRILNDKVVDTRDSFANGKSIRAMADECGLLDMYRQVYSIASGVSHSEWWSLETHCLERCHNVLHRAHLIPSLSLNAGNNIKFAQSWVDTIYTLMRTSLQILGTDGDAIGKAFAWLDGTGPQNDSE